MGLNLNLEDHFMRLFLFFMGDETVRAEREESFEDESVFLFYDFPNGLGSERVLGLFEHGHQSFDLPFVFISDLLIALNLEVKTLRVVYPIDAFPPGDSVLQFLENVVKLFFGGLDVFLLRVDHQIVVLGEDGN